MVVLHTRKMQDRLDRIARLDPEARVIGQLDSWPVIRDGGGRLLHLSSEGKLVALSAAERWAFSWERRDAF